jgi:cytochrome b
MNQIKAYDFPLRVFHWLFAFLFSFSFLVAKVIDDESATYAFHMISGMLMIILLFFRLIWGLVGSKYSKFSSFKLELVDLKAYFLSLFRGKTTRYPGHNPASSFAASFMFFFTILMAISGLLMVLKFKKYFFEEIHEIVSSGFAILVGLHILGVIFHQLRHKDGLIYSMINGKKENFNPEEGIKSNHLLIALFFVAGFLYLSFNLYQRFDAHSGNLKLGNYSLHLVDVED